MSDTESPKAKSSWTDRELLVYLFALVEHSGVKFDYATTPRPTGRTVRACSERIGRLKATLKNDLTALRNGGVVKGHMKGGSSCTTRKRKGRDGDGGKEGGMLGEMARKRMKEGVVPEVEGEDDEEEMVRVKDEPGFEDDDEA